MIIPTRNPHAGRLARTLEALRTQTLARDCWELVIVDNGSTPPLSPPATDLRGFHAATVVVEPEIGLTSARRCGLGATRGKLCVFVDDDNVLAPDYLARAVELFAVHPKLGCAGGKSLPEFEVGPPAWTAEFFPLLALRDLGDAPQFADALCPPGAPRNTYPQCAPIGAGMIVRRAALADWFAAPPDRLLADRRGEALSSAGDNDIVFHVLKAGWSAGYFPSLVITHLIPANRLTADYLARLNRGIQQSWMHVLRRHDANPWPPLTPFGAALRQAKAVFTSRPWRGPAERVRWHGVCGHFAGRVL